MIVMKFGGTSTQDPTSILNVINIIKSQLSKKPVIVISAIAQATNLLERAAKIASEQKTKEAHSILDQLSNRHLSIIDDLIKDSNRNQKLKEFVTMSLSELKELINGVSILRELTPRTLDSIYCYGELFSSRIVAEALKENGVKSEWLDTKEFMITDENFNCALPIMQIVEERLKPLIIPIIELGTVPVTQGFIGYTLSGFRTTMGRESSDYSASIIGAVLDVNDIQIWTDVDGVLTADPVMVSDAKKIKRLSFEEAYMLSYFGAKVLHPNTMLPAIEKNIPIHIYNSKRPHSSGTLVTNSQVNTKPIVKSIAYKRGVVIITIKPKKRFGQYLFWEHIQNVLTKFNVVPSIIVTSEYQYSFVTDAKTPTYSIQQELSDVGTVDVDYNKGLISIVGSEIKNVSEIVARVFKTISNTTIDLISFGASRANISFVLNDEKVPNAVQRLHAEFFNHQDDEIFEVI